MSVMARLFVYTVIAGALGAVVLGALVFGYVILITVVVPILAAFSI